MPAQAQQQHRLEAVVQVGAGGGYGLQQVGHAIGGDHRPEEEPTPRCHPGRIDPARVLSIRTFGFSRTIRTVGYCPNG
ncbi:hypothetical protein GCM10018962_96940 [Dactylosporangium matsuzakiense]|uniref:Uncharacterized protein n=1 Tax=Dactylosporangium matsuzakiense TaxID=53360 RepID=A0A9W6KF11_9ACTN|nr:hypothetical protein GCM10017581_018480 [Dactylosporangium matsuzakiense]